MRTQNLGVMKSTTVRTKELQAQLDSHSLAIARLELVRTSEVTDALREQLQVAKDDIRHLRNTVDILQELALGRQGGRHDRQPSHTERSGRPASRDSRHSEHSRSTQRSSISGKSVQSRISEAQLEALYRRGPQPSWEPTTEF